MHKCRQLPRRRYAPRRADAPPCAAALNDNIWYYKDRSGVPRGPCTLTTVRKCWVHGVVDQYTLVWGQGLEDWYPVRNVIGLITNIQSLDGAPRRPKSPLSGGGRLAAPPRPHRACDAARWRPGRPAARRSGRMGCWVGGCAPKPLCAPKPCADAACAAPVVVLKWIHDKFFLNPRLARARQAVRSQRGGALPAGR
jgi:hypothetical protein